MNVNKKCIFVLILVAGLSVNAYSETFFGIGGGLFRLGDEFHNENYGRSMVGGTAVFSFYHFTEDSPLGVSVQVFPGSVSSGMEWNDDKMSSMNYISGFSDIRISVAPSYILRLGPQVRIPFTLGPLFSMNTEQGDFSSYDANNNWEYRNTHYEAIDFGLLGSGTVIFNPIPRFNYISLKGGFSAEWEFLRVERGEMNMEFRQFKSANFKGVRYMSLGFSLFFGMGILLE